MEWILSNDKAKNGQGKEFEQHSRGKEEGQFDCDWLFTCDCMVYIRQSHAVRFMRPSEEEVGEDCNREITWMIYDKDKGDE